MDNQRLFLWIALLFIVFLNYQAWQTDYAPPPPAAPTTASAPQTSASGAPSSGLTESVPGVGAAPTGAASTGTAGAAGATGVPAPAAAPAPTPTVAGGLAVAAPASAPSIRVRTDVLDLTISTIGGELQRAELLEYPLKKNQPNVPVRLLNTDSPESLFLLQTGLTAGGTGDEPTHRAAFTAEAAQYTLGAGQDEISVPLTWTNGAGLTVKKTYTFRRGSYAIALRYDVTNAGATPWRAAPYAQIVRHWTHVERSMWDPETYAFRGPAIWDGNKYRKLDVEDEEDAKFSASITDGWLAALQHHFTAAIVPDTKVAQQYSLSVKDKDFLLRTVGAVREVPAGGTATITQNLFVGPKLQAQLQTLHPELRRVADYGKLTIIAQPLFWVLSKVHAIVGNWGWAIILVTLLIKLAFYKLAETSGRSMARMRNLAPRMKDIQEKYKDDRDQLGRAMMELYKREKINPVAGCLPILVQIPVFIAFYWVLLESVEMRQAPWLGWIQDLSTRDPYFILPAVMTGAMFAQFKLQPAPPDPIQAKVFAFMPLMMGAMMAFFPSGLVLYWITNTALSIAQQWRINKVVAAEDKERRK